MNHEIKLMVLAKQTNSAYTKTLYWSTVYLTVKTIGLF